MRQKYIFCMAFILSLTNIGVSNTIINHSFESYSVLTTPTGLLRKMPNYWDWRSQGNINGFAKDVWSSEGDLALYMYCQRFNTHYAGDYLEFYQIIDLTGVDTILFDVYFSSQYLFSKPYVSINSQKLWSKTGSNELLGESIDTSGFSGMCEIAIGLEVLIPFSYPSYEWADGNTYFDNFIAIPKPAIEVAIDIRPKSCFNPLNLQSKGVLPVAVLGTEDFDVNDIDIASVRLADVAPFRSNYLDITGLEANEPNACGCAVTCPDGYTDLMLKFRTSELAEALTDIYGEIVRGDELELTLTGELYDGTLIEGLDYITVVGKEPKRLKRPKLEKMTR